MTILNAIKTAALYCGVEQPAAIFTSSVREVMEFREVAQQAGRDLALAHDWQKLKTEATIAGDGSTTSFDLPSDYLRMPRDQLLWSSSQESPMTHIPDHNAWLELDVKDYALVKPSWTMLGGQIAIKPTPTATETVRYYYQSNKWAVDASGTAKSMFTADTDELRFGGDATNMLATQIIWRWRALKRLDYAEDLNNAQRISDREIMADKGPGVKRVGRTRYRRGVSIAYPVAITS